MPTPGGALRHCTGRWSSLRDTATPPMVRGGGLHAYRPREKALEKLFDVKRGVSWLRSCRGQVLVVTQSAVLQIDPATGKGTCLLDADIPGATPFSSRPSIARKIVLSPLVVLVGREVLYSDQHNATFLRSYTQEAGDAVSVWGRVFPGEPPRRHALRDLALTDDGLLLLTDDGLYRVPALHGKP